MKHSSTSNTGQEKVGRSSRDFEKKFPVSIYNTDYLLDLLNHVCLSDRKYPENEVFTVFYDTEDLEAYYESVNGNTVKSKLRIRWYGETHAAQTKGKEVFIEVKTKKGLKVEKTRKQLYLPAAYFDDMDLTDPFWQGLPEGILTELGWRNPARLWPVVLTRYRRSRFLDGVSGARIALDREIASLRVNTDVLPAAQATRLGMAVLEVKGGDGLPLILDMVSGITFQWEAFSKYSLCLSASMGKEFFT